MNCIYCGTPLSNIDYCTGCGADVTIQKRIVRISNLLYNEGLDKAKVRDLSGAIRSLRRSLKFNKENVDARNLLGLVYFESGEVVSALTEWVISKNMNVEGNAAEFYIDKLQSNKNKLDVINQTIRKYNQALVYCREDNDDMASIQLKKVLNQNPNLIKAYHLQALLYLKRQEYEKARKLLKKAAYIDTNNTTTLRYLQEVEAATGMSTSLDMKHKKRYAKEKVNRLTGTTTYMNGNEMIIQPTTFRDSSAVATFINIFLGLLIGAALVWFLVVPATKQSINESANKQVTDANSRMASEVSKIQGLEEQITQYESEVTEATKASEDAKTQISSYDDLLNAANLYLANNTAEAASAYAKVSADSISGNGKTLYESLGTALGDYVYTEAYAAGANAYSSGDYKTAITELKKAVAAKSDGYDAYYYLAFSYYNTNDTDNANKIFQEIVQKFPTQATANNISSYITSSGSSSGSTDTTDTGDTTGTTDDGSGTADDGSGTADDGSGTTDDGSGTTDSGNSGGVDANSLLGIQ